MRNPANWQVYAQGSQPTMPYGGRGYTGHEQLNQFGLINMNARLYDPLLARFLGPDPQVSEPEISNGYNRYEYALNNPMMYVDVNGEQAVHPDGIDIPNIYHNAGNSTNGSGTISNTNTEGNSYSNSLYNPGNGSNLAYHEGVYGSDYGGYGGGSGGVSFNGLGSVVVGLIQWLFGTHVSQDSYKTILTNTNTSNSYAKKITLKNPVGTGASTVYSGASKKSQGNSNSSWTNEAQNGLPVWGASKQFQDAINNSDYTNAACFLVLGFFEAFTLGEGTEVRLGMNAARIGERAFFSGAGTEARAIEQGYQTLVQTRAGQNLAKLTADMPYYPGSQAYKMWGRLSTQWAKGASGEVNVFQNAAKGVDLQSIWRVYEYPALKGNPNVTNIIFHY